MPTQSKLNAWKTIVRDTVADLAPLTFRPPVEYVYNPLEYARETFLDYARRYGNKESAAVLLGMNPGPWGMTQTGIPFGEVHAVRDWLRIDKPIRRPPREHPKRPVLGLSCPRREISGKRLWGWAADHFRTPGRFFREFFVANYCPLVFLEAGGRNITPDKLPAAELRPLQERCDRALQRVVSLLKPRCIIGVGAYAEACARRALPDTVPVYRILHPSPASPAANRGWAEQVTRQLEALGIRVPASGGTAQERGQEKLTR